MNSRGVRAALGLSVLGFALYCGPALGDPVAAGRYYEDGLARFDRGDVSGAIVQLKNALQQERGMLAAQLLLARAYWQAGDVRAAAVAFEEAQRLGVNRAEVAAPLGAVYLAEGEPGKVIERILPAGLPAAVQVEILTLRGTAYTQLGKAKEAEQSFADARRLDPRSARPLIAEVPVLLGAGRAAEAGERAQRAVELAPQEAAAWNARASVAHAGGDLSAALKDYGRAIALRPDFVDPRIARAGVFIDLGREADARGDLDALAKVAPNEPRAAYLRAVLAARAGDDKTAAAHLAEAVRVVDHLPAEWVAAQEQILMLGALAHYGLGHREQAHAYLESLVGRYPRNSGARKLLASMELEAGGAARAAALLDPLLAAQPNDVEALYLMGRARLARQRYHEANEYLERAATLSAGRDPRVQASLGIGQLGAGHGELGLASLANANRQAPGDPALATFLATLYLQRGEPARARDVAERLLQSQPDQLLALNLAGVVRQANGDGAGARRAFDDALRRDPGFAAARLNLARLDAAEGREAEARQALVALLDKNRGDVAVLYELARLDRRAGRLAEAVERLEQAIAARPKDLGIARALVETLLARGDAAGALTRAKAIAAERNDDPAALELLGRTELAAGDRAGAARTFSAMSRFAGDDVAAQIRVGQLQLAAGNPDGAAYGAWKALSVKADDADALVLAVEAELARGSAEQAEAQLQRLRSARPQDVAELRLAGDLAMLRRQYERAAESYRQAMARQPSTAHALRHARAWLEGGRLDRSAAVLRAWLKTRPTDSAVRKALAEVLMRAGDWPAARAEYEELAGAGADAMVLNNFANVLLRLHDPAAVAVARRAHALAPSSAAVIDTLGWALAENGHAEEGLAQLREARLRKPASAEIRYHLAHVLHATGRSGEARGEIEALLASTPADELPEGARQLASTLGL